MGRKRAGRSTKKGAFSSHQIGAAVRSWSLGTRVERPVRLVSHPTRLMTVERLPHQASDLARSRRTRFGAPPKEL